MDKYKIIFNDYEPKYIQLSNNIKRLINEKEIDDGEKLPSIRALSKELSVNNITIVNCYNRLKTDGYAYQKMGSGTYVKRKEISDVFYREYGKVVKALKNKDNHSNIDFIGEQSNVVHFPMENFKKVINEVLNRDGVEALLNQEPLGYIDLRCSINEVFWSSKLDIDNVVIVSGAQQGIDIASKAILNINDNVIVENPTYRGALSVFKFRRANVFEVDIKDDGIDIEMFESILKKNKIKCFYTMSYFHNPTGVTYSYEKKKKILDLAEKYDFYIIEDDYLSELIYDEEIEHLPFKSMDKNDRVIYIKSFSKVFLPGIRLGYIIAPALVKESISDSKINTDITTSTLMQRVLDLYIREGYFIKYIKTLKEEYITRYKYMKTLIENELKDYVTFLDPKGGLSIYLKINNREIDSIELFHRLKNKNVYITPGVVFYKDKELGKSYFRIGFSQVNLEEIDSGIQYIKEELEKWHIQQ